MNVLPCLLLALLCYAVPLQGTAWAERHAQDNAFPQRIISLAPSVTELLFALDCGSRVAGRSTNSTTPHEARDIPDVGPYNRPSAEKILALHPDLCIALRDGTPATVIRQLRRAGSPVLVLDIESFESLGKAVITLGKALGQNEKASLAAAQLKQRLHAARQRLGKYEDRPTVLFQLQAAPLIAAGLCSFAGRLIENAGGINAVRHSPSSYPVLGMEDALLLDPDVIIIAGMGNAEEDAASARRWKRWKHIAAVRSGRVHIVDSDIFTRPSLRAVDALETLISLLHPDKN